MAGKKIYSRKFEFGTSVGYQMPYPGRPVASPEVSLSDQAAVIAVPYFLDAMEVGINNKNGVEQFAVDVSNISKRSHAPSQNQTANPPQPDATNPPKPKIAPNLPSSPVFCGLALIAACAAIAAVYWKFRGKGEKEKIGKK